MNKGNNHIRLMLNFVWQPTPVCLPGESRAQRSLVGCSPLCFKESDTTEVSEPKTPNLYTPILYNYYSSFQKYAKIHVSFIIKGLKIFIGSK